MTLFVKRLKHQHCKTLKPDHSSSFVLIGDKDSGRKRIVHWNRVSSTKFDVECTTPGSETSKAAGTNSLDKDDV